MTLTPAAKPMMGTRTMPTATKLTAQEKRPIASSFLPHGTCMPASFYQAVTLLVMHTIRISTPARAYCMHSSLAGPT